jgi:trk/ktr system potassium uptake protein
MGKARVGVSDRVTVIGLGRFGTSVARTLNSLGYDVTAIDLDEQRVEEASDFVALAAQGDGTDEETLRQLQVDRSDVAIVAQGSRLEVSVLTTLILKKLGVPIVIAKAQTDLQGEVLRRIGADRVVFPERDAAVRLAHAIAVLSISDYITLSPTSGVAKFIVPASFVGQSLAELVKVCNGKLSVLAIVRGDNLLTSPALDERVQTGDELVIAGPDVEIETFVESGDAGATQ